MIINKNGDISGNTKEFQKIEINGTMYYLNGLFYFDGNHIGEESVRAFDEAALNDESGCIERMRGSFSLIIKKADRVTVYSDNSNMHCFYYSEDCISNSCIELTRFMKKSGKKISLNDEAIYQQYAFGKVFGPRTYVNEIRFTDYSEYVVIVEGKIHIENKNIGDISCSSTQQSMASFLHSFGRTIKGEKVACALTGGYDSRMIFAILNNELDNLDCVICGDNKEDKDIIVSKKVAEVAGANWQLIDAQKPRITGQYLEEVFNISDGLEMYIDTYRLRWLQYVDYLRKNDYSVCLSGDGGVLHKDWEWKQDIPFYNKKKTDLNRYYLQRIACQQDMRNAGNRLLALVKPQKEWFLKQLKSMQKETNTQSYDMFYNYLNGNRRFEYNLCNGKNLFYAPLQEMDIVRYSYHLPRFDRTFYNQNRMVTSEANLNVARVPTNYGTNASNLTSDKIIDIWFELRYMLIRISRHLYRRFTKKTIGGQKATTWTCTDDIRHNNLAKDALAWAKRNEYASNQCKMDDLNERKIGAIIYGYLWDKLIKE